MKSFRNYSNIKTPFLILIAVLSTGVLSAQTGGIHFEHGLTWKEVLQKAKKENKHIFIDCYTTWCGPCRMMSAQVFPKDDVGKFFNDHYINLKVQLDTTAKDNKEIKSWYASAKQLADNYNVMVYPTYLFFDPNGTK